MITIFEGSKVGSWGKKGVSLQYITKIIGARHGEQLDTGVGKERQKVSLGLGDKVEEHNSGTLTSISMQKNDA